VLTADECAPPPPQGNAEVEAWVSKTGGDVARIRPAENWQIRQHLDLDDGHGANVEEAAQIQVSAQG
jgi:hypothetical protein